MGRWNCYCHSKFTLLIVLRLAPSMNGSLPYNNSLVPCGGVANLISTFIEIRNAPCSDALLAMQCKIIFRNWFMTCNHLHLK